MAYKVPYNRDELVHRILGKVSSLISSGEKVYYVNVHAVGCEYRIGNCSLEAVCAQWRSWYEAGKRTDLTEDQYQQVKKVLVEQWVKDGELYKDRGIIQR